MPRFYFHLFNDVTACDPEGLELPDKDAALEQARINARAMAAQSVCDGRLVLGHYIDIRDEQDATVGKVYYRDVVTVEGA